MHPLTDITVVEVSARHPITIAAVPSPPDVHVVVPTLGTRPESLHEALTSIRDQDVPADITIVAPSSSESARAAAREFNAQFVEDPGALSAAINKGMALRLPHYKYVTWLNDDDVWVAGSLRATFQALEGDPRAVVAFGWCEYVDAAGRTLWVSKVGRWAVRVLNWGPDLIPQPGMLIRASAWDQVGGLDESYRLAFDFDLLLRLKKLGPLVDTQMLVSRFQWHPDSLTVDDRSTNLRESERAKRSALPVWLRPISHVWDVPVRVAIKLAVARVNRRARSTTVV